jgi:pepF/M3 family oligoendopeptidase
MKNWDLNDLYHGFDDAYERDLKKLEDKMDDLKNYILYQKQENDMQYIEGYIKREEEIVRLSRSLGAFASLTMATNVNHEVAPRYMAKLQQIFRKVTAEQVIFQRYLASVDLNKVKEHSSLIRKYLYLLKKDQEDATHLLSEKEEVLYSKMREFASSGWSQLHSITTANLPVDFEGKEITLSEIRNLAYDNDKDIREKAYHAELKAYEKIEDQVAFALSNIKREVTTMNDLRGYESALSKTLTQSNMTKETLDAMIEAMLEYRPHFAAYLKEKANYLGHKGSLPFYDLFAPVGKLTKTYTYEEAQKIIKDAFYGYSKRLGDFATKAFDHNWIDPFPNKGKRGGAFCSNQPQIKQSRILSNFTGSLSDVLTLAHELGHGYHGEVIADNDPLHWSYPMPLAETASIFCETIVNNYLLKSLKKDEEKLSVLENSLQGDTQVIVDILSRYMFESKLFENATGPINKKQMKEWMLEAQKEAYTDGLDHEVLHPYMWLNKGHYYSAGLSFYNFPYAFGLLFGKGLYAAYLKDPDKFLLHYDHLLELTTKTSVEEVAKTMDIDVTSKDFWISSLEQVKKDIDEVILLFKK